MSTLVSEPSSAAASTTTNSAAAAHARVAGCGFLMGAADIVPGVSGGTVALILGVYERLVTAISRCDLTALALLRNKEFRGAAERIDLLFVMPLGIGIVSGAGLLSSLMTYLLTNHQAPTYAVFSGMILASSILVGKRVKNIRAAHVALIMTGIAIALRVVTLSSLQNPPDALWYLFLCGTIGITAMILPGISGAFILLLLGQYHTITDQVSKFISGLFRLQLELNGIIMLTVFALGCLTGLLSFSRVLKWLLAKYQDATMAILCGFMVGSLYKLWPFQTDITPEIEKFRHKTFEPVMPAHFDGQVVLTVMLAVLGCAVVLGLEKFANRDSQTKSPADTDES